MSVSQNMSVAEEAQKCTREQESQAPRRADLGGRGAKLGAEVQPGGGPQLVQAVPVPLQQREQANAQEVPVEGADPRLAMSEAKQVQA